MSFPQSARHIMMMDPVDFHANVQTAETNQYQFPDPDDIAAVQNAARREFRAYRDILVEHGVVVTTVLGRKGCPDDVFCNNWVSTHAALKEGQKARMVLYPMLAENRRLERRPNLINVLKNIYDVTLDLTQEELEGRYLESTGSLAIDRVNGVVYSALSARTNRELAEKCAAHLGHDIVFFDTQNHAGTPVYHTDVLMFVGTGYIGICSECILDKDRDRVINRISQTHEIIDLSMDQLRSFCGNALEVRGTGEKKFLAMSQSAHNVLRSDQIQVIEKYTSGIISSDLSTIEKYGGGSARCMLLELH